MENSIVLGESHLTPRINESLSLIVPIIACSPFIDMIRPIACPLALMEQILINSNVHQAFAFNPPPTISWFVMQAITEYKCGLLMMIKSNPSIPLEELADQVMARVNLIIQMVYVVLQMVLFLWPIMRIIECKDLMPVVDSSTLLEVKARMKINFTIHLIFAIFIIISPLHLFSW